MFKSKVKNYLSKYPLELKIKVVSEYKKHSSGFLARKYGIKVGTIKNWIYRYRHGKLNLNFFKEEQQGFYKKKYEVLKKFLDFISEKKNSKFNLLRNYKLKTKSTQ